MARLLLLGVLFLVCSVHAIPEETVSAMQDLLEFVQEEESKDKAVPDVFLLLVTLFCGFNCGVVVSSVRQLPGF